MNERTVPVPEKDCHVIKCDVINCVYNNTEKYCTAKKIKVGPQYAVNANETLCNTFAQNSLFR